MKAIWNDTVLAESKETILLENNHYFPAGAVDQKYLKESANTSTCPWKGKAKYYHVEVDGEVNDNAAWYYPEPKPAAEDIKGHVAFYKGVKIVTE
ncbi:DUF427 domain-containing protein [Litoribacter populi]|uniref:DUF427 domain-containing protein n=1 Tax=Litoribacter populi TaxID=2598460 RepID=UPI00163DD5F6|nr:DUF427 domain-containing protein [Litoribacter populi]